MTMRACLAGRATRWSAAIASSLALFGVLIAADAARLAARASDSPAAPAVTSALAAGGAHSLAITATGEAWAWGDNHLGQLGTGDFTSRRAPVRMAGLGGPQVAVAAGLAHSLAAGADGRVRGWGLNSDAQLGDGSRTLRSAPVTLAGLADVVAVAAGSAHSLALTRGGVVWTWGRNADGQLGDGTTTSRTRPIRVTGLPGIVAIAAGANHSIALDGTGVVWAWGANEVGQLGDGTTKMRRAPVRIKGIASVRAVAAGSLHTLALTEGGHLWAWGWNGSGQLGDGTRKTRTMPVIVQSVPAVRGIAAGGAHSLASTSDGTLLTWGSNLTSQLGDGGTADRLVPGAVAAPPGGVTRLAGGAVHSLALGSDAVTWSWGNNVFGQIGDGSNVAARRPVPISGAELAWGVASPVLTPGARLSHTPISVTVTTITPGATIHYTTNGSDPTEADPIVVSGGTIAIDRTTSVRARAWKSGMTPSGVTGAIYEMAVEAVVLTPGGGTYSSLQSITMSTATPGADIRYTLDGADPTEISTLYAGPVRVETDLVLKARGYRSGWTPSAVVAAAYTYAFGTLATPIAVPPGGTYTQPQHVTLTADAGATIHYTLDGSEPTDASPVFTAPVAIPATTTLSARAFRQHYTPSATVVQQYVIEAAPPPPADTPPPDPSTVAPPLPEEAVTSFSDASAFLYSGPDAIQRNVTPGAHDRRRVAIVRGRVLTRDGEPLAGVRVAVQGDPEIGYAVTRADGVFDYAVNGGSLLTLDYSRPGYLPAQRRVDAPWEDAIQVEDVRLLGLDANVTVVPLDDRTDAHVARGSIVADEDGARQATLIVPEGGLTANITLPDGSVVPALSQLSIRATEYTVGTNGAQAMPAALPATSGYTYAVELSADEALRAGATGVTFDRPLAFYVENYLDFPVGGVVPVGYYDRQQAQWVPLDNGRIVRVLSTDASGRAELDIDGGGTAASAEQLTELGVTAGELLKVASLYQPGQSLWRAPIPHFSPIDLNWPYRLPPGAGPPGGGNGGGPPWTDPETQTGLQESPSGEVENPCEASGSIIECQNQALGERIPVAGTPFSLAYRSNEAFGTKSRRTLTIPLSGDAVPEPLKRIDVEVSVAGQTHRESFPPLPNQTMKYVWDGADGFGRAITGGRPATARVNYVYDAEFVQPAAGLQSFGQTGQGPSLGRARAEVSLGRSIRYSARAMRLGQQAIGGWGVDVHHRFDAGSQTIYFGDGTQRTATAIGDVLRTVAGGGDKPISSEGVAARQAKTGEINSLGFAADGTLFFSNIDYDNSRSGIAVLTTGGIVRELVTFAENNGVESDDFRPTFVPARGSAVYYSAAELRSFCGEGGYYESVRIWHLTAGGERTLIARVALPHRVNGCSRTGLALGADGTFYLTAGQWLYRVVPDAARPDEPVDARELAEFDDFVNAMARAADGRVFVAGYNFVHEWHNGTTRSVTDSFTADFFAETMFLEHDTLFALNAIDSTILVIRPDGAITKYAGGGPFRPSDDVSPDGSLASTARLSSRAMAPAPDGTIYIGDYAFKSGYPIRRLEPPFGRASGGAAFQLPSADGAEVYEFDVTGLHLRTTDALTRVVLYEFVYDNYRLIGIRDRDGLLTAIERSGNAPAAIVGPFGARTQLSVDAEGRLTQVTDPEGHAIGLGYDSGGLLTSLTDANQQTHTFDYDELGRLVRDADPAGGAQTLARTDLRRGWRVDQQIADGGATAHITEQLQDGKQRRTTIHPDGTQTVVMTERDGKTTMTGPDGTRTTIEQEADPRFQFAAPIASRSTVVTPGGLTMTTIKTRGVTLGDTNDPLSLMTLTDTVAVNKSESRTVFDAAARTITTTSPLKRTSVTTLDASGRPASVRVGTLTPTTFQYDAAGRLISQARGGRVTRFEYDDNGYVDAITDALERTVSFTNDRNGRRVAQVFPDQRTASFVYDGNGNLTTLSVPGGSVHELAYTPVNQLERYTPPATGPPAATSYAFDRAAHPTIVTRADGQTLEWRYDTAGRISELVTPAGNSTYQYDPLTGQLRGISSPGSTLTYTFDGALQTSETWGGAGAGTVAWTYDNHFRVTSERVLGGNAATFVYDGDGLLARAGNLVLTRDAANGFVTATSLNGISSTHGYSGFGELANESVTAGGASRFSAAYTRDAVGRLTQKTETVLGTTHVEAYTYDPAGRLTAVTRDGAPWVAYGYDDNGNRSTTTTLAGVVPATYDAQDRLVAAGALQYRYTAAGELAAIVDATTNAATAYTYDVQGNLREVALPNGTRVGYSADARNRRIARLVNGLVAQRLLYQGQLRPVAELDAAGALVSRFVYGTRPITPEYLIRGGVTYRLVTDHLGSVRLVLNATTGAVVQQLEYDPFGQVLVDTNPGFQPFGYAGGLYDPLTGLLRFGARDYDPATGRWLSKDPIGFKGGDSNLYAYVGNDPINNTDPTGLFVTDVLDLVFLGQDIAAFVRCPGLGTGFWLAVSAIGALPGVPSLGWIDDAMRSKPGRIVIGENMNRVADAAQRLGADVFEGAGMEANRAWIQSKRAQGYEIFDIGPDFSRRAERAAEGIRPDSAYYNMERMETKGYDGYVKLWQRTGRNSGSSAY
jgi:RHS repeat-associated protein